MKDIISHLVHEDGFKTVLTVLLTIFMTTAGYYIKTKFERKSEFKKEVGKKLVEALQNVRDIANKMNTIEVYDVEEIGRKASFDMSYYPGVLTDETSLNTFLEDLTDMRRKTEQYLSNKVAAHIFVLERYIMDLYPAAKEYIQENTLPDLGIRLLNDFKRWSVTLDELAVSEMNNNNCVIQSHSGRNWEREKESVFQRMYVQSELMVINNEINLTCSSCTLEGDVK